MIWANPFTNLLVTLRHDDGEVETVVAGPEVKRFDALKVGDAVTFGPASRSSTRNPEAGRARFRRRELRE